jgi:hypothetical protein
VKKNYHMRFTDNYITIDRARVNIHEIINWAKSTCPTYITNAYHANYEGNDLIDLYFMNNEQGRKEMNWLLLRWA